MKLSICTITYNQEKFIRQCIESILMQNVDFDYEIIIADDCSTDNTRSILLEYQKKYPNIIKLILHESNVGVLRNFKSVLDAGSGQYIALCEGDDYWISPDKLQIQVDFLEANPDYSICFHRAKIEFYNITPFKFDDYNANTPATTSIKDLIKGNYIHTPTCVYRNGLFGKFPEAFLNFKMGDWPLHLLNAQYGKIHFIPVEMAVYRVYSQGVWSVQSLIKRTRIAIQFLIDVKRYFPPAYNKLFEQSKNGYIKYLIKQYFHKSELTNLFMNLPQILKWYFS